VTEDTFHYDGNAPLESWVLLAPAVIVALAASAPPVAAAADDEDAMVVEGA
jgi:hypothetical protein